jgi:hypothetical protein
VVMDFACQHFRILRLILLYYSSLSPLTKEDVSTNNGGGGNYGGHGMIETVKSFAAGETRTSSESNNNVSIYNTTTPFLRESI